MQINYPISAATDEGRYLIACARIRNMTMSALVRDLITAIARDQLVRAGWTVSIVSINLRDPSNH